MRRDLHMAVRNLGSVANNSPRLGHWKVTCERMDTSCSGGLIRSRTEAWANPLHSRGDLRRILSHDVLDPGLQRGEGKDGQKQRRNADRPQTFQGPYSAAIESPHQCKLAH